MRQFKLALCFIFPWEYTYAYRTSSNSICKDHSGSDISVVLGVLYWSIMKYSGLKNIYICTSYILNTKYLMIPTMMLDIFSKTFFNITLFLLLIQLSGFIKGLPQLIRSQVSALVIGAYAHKKPDQKTNHHKLSTLWRVVLINYVMLRSRKLPVKL